MRHGIGRTDTIVAGRVFSSAPPSSESPEPAAAPDGFSSLRRWLPDARFFAGDDVVFRGIATSSSEAKPDQLIVYRIGEDCPTQVVADALARGASGILTEQLLPCPLPQCIVGDLDAAVAKITAQQKDRPDRKLLSIGVIGDAGKTTTTLLVAALLRGSGIRTGYQCDLGSCDGVVQATESSRLPAGAQLVEWLDEAVACDCRAAVVELTNEQARQGRYDAVQFDLLIVTGTATCDDDYGPSGLQCGLELLAPGGAVIVSAEDGKALRAVRDAGARVVTYGVRRAADVTAKIIDQSGGMTTLLMSHQNVTAVMETSLCGAAMAANHAAATMVGLLLGEPIEKVVETLSQLRTIPGRGQRMESFGNAAVVLDAGGSPQRVEAVLQACCSMKSGGRLWCVLATDGNDSPESLARYGGQLERWCDQAIVTSQPHSKTSFLKTSHSVLDGVDDCALFRLVADRRRAIEWAVSEASPGDTVLVITGERGRTAIEQRQDLEQIGGWVESTRQQHATSDSAPKLKIVRA